MLNTPAEIKSISQRLIKKTYHKPPESVRLWQSTLTYDRWITLLDYFSSNSFLVERRSSLMSISKKSFHGIKKCCYVRYQKCEKFPNASGKLKVYISVNLTSALTNKDDRQFSAKLNRAYGEVARMQINCRY